MAQFGGARRSGVFIRGARGRARVPPTFISVVHIYADSLRRKHMPSPGGWHCEQPAQDPGACASPERGRGTEGGLSMQPWLD